MNVKTYGLCADLHLHAWSAFAGVDAEGRNTRLMAIIHELERCCEATLKAGGHGVVIAGDIFHERGKIAPSVFNPLREMIARMRRRGLVFWGVPGNHDLEGKETTELGSAAAMLEGDDIHFIHQNWAIRFNRLFVPWCSTPALYLEMIGAAVAKCDEENVDVGELDLICHIGIDGTLTNMPDHGVSVQRLLDFGFKRVFSGHYHHHRDFGNGIYSIGALTHQTWSDVGTKAGFLIVHPDRVDWHASHAPSFIDLTGEEDPSELELIVEGQYVRTTIGEASAKLIGDMRVALLAAGARGVQIRALPASKGATRVGATAKSLASIDRSVMTYIDEKSYGAKVAAICADILTEVRSGT